jgi:hypothetical protein
MTISKPFYLGPKFVSAERALSAVRAGSRVYIGTGCGAPHSLLAHLEAMNPGPADLEFVSFVTTSAYRRSKELRILTTAIELFLLVAKCAVWHTAANSTTCPYR